MAIILTEIGELLDEKLSTLEERFDKKLDEKLQPINHKLSDISGDLAEIRRDLSYDNLRVIKKRNEEI